MKRSLFGAAFVLHRAINSTGTLLLFPKHLHEKNDFLINSAGILRPTQQPRGVSLLLSHWYICAGETFSLLHCHSGSVGRKRKSGELTKQRKVTPEGERAHSLEPQLAKVEPSTRSTAGEHTLLTDDFRSDQKFLSACFEFQPHGALVAAYRE